MNGTETLRQKYKEIVDCMERWGVKPTHAHIGEVVSVSAWRKEIVPYVRHIPDIRTYVRTRKLTAEYVEKEMKFLAERSYIEQDVYYPMLEELTEIIENYDESIDHGMIALLEKLNAPR